MGRKGENVVMALGNGTDFEKGEGQSAPKFQTGVAITVIIKFAKSYTKKSVGCFFKTGGFSLSASLASGAFSVPATIPHRPSRLRAILHWTLQLG